MGFLNGSVRLGRLFDITVRVHVLFFVLIGYWLITSGDWVFQLMFSAMLFGIVLVHEFGHCFGARAVGGEAHDILMWPLGGLAYAHAPMDPWPQFVTVAAGPAVNVVFCIVSAAVLLLSGAPHELVSLRPFAPMYFNSQYWEYYVHVFFRVNYFLLLFNLLPVFPLDGGQLFRTLIWPFMGLHRATIVSAQMGIVGAVCLGILGALNNEFMLIAIAIFGGMTSYQHLQAARGGLATEHFLSANSVLRDKRRTRGLFARLFGRRRDTTHSGSIEFPAADPDDWRARKDEREREEAELDRLLKKVSERGIQSLSYVERQRLERITRERQQREQEIRSGGPR